MEFEDVRQPWDKSWRELRLRGHTCGTDVEALSVGVGVQIDVARKAAKSEISFSPMVGMNSVVSLAASIHAASVCTSVGVEYNPFPNPLQSELGEGLMKPSKGTIEVPRKPGWELRWTAGS